MDFKVGQVLNSRGNGIFGKLIGFRNGLIYGKEHNWTHSAIISEVKKDSVVVHEALSKGFIKSDFDKGELSNRIKNGHYVIGNVKSKLKDVKKHAKEYEGIGYGFRDILGIIVFWLFGTESKFLSTGAQRLICSEAVARILYDSSGKKIDFEKEFMIPYDLIEPMTLWRSKHIRWNG